MEFRNSFVACQFKGCTVRRAQEFEDDEDGTEVHLNDDDILQEIPIDEEGDPIITSFLFVRKGRRDDDLLTV